jgi:pimeloyl-ACP methyl ester carboxylesterase
MTAMAANAKLKHVHLVGHSTGAILVAHLLEAIDRWTTDVRISTCSLMAPAATVGLWKTHYYPPLVAGASVFGIDQMTVYNLDARLEEDDNVAGVYRKSLLFLVSHAFEEETPAPLLGMKIHNDGLAGKVPKGRLEFCYSNGRGGPKTRTSARTHGGFDNDVRTMNDILRRVLGKTRPRRLFTRGDLDY